MRYGTRPPGRPLPTEGPGPGGRGILSLLGLFVLAGVPASCDIPTASPRWETRWIVPAEETSISVAEILPDGVALSPDSSAFAIQVDPVSFSRSLGSLCGGCQPLNGQTVPKPAFQGSFQQSVSFPAQVVSVEVSQGTLTIQAKNGFGFDPLRPGGGNTGTLTLTVYDGDAGGPVVDRIVMDGATEAFAPGSTISKVLDLSGTLGNTLTVEVEVDSPAGDATLIDTAQELTLSATPSEVLVSSADVQVANQDIQVAETALDVEDVDASIVDRVKSGAFEFDITNPWSIAASLSLVIDGPTMASPVTKSISIPASGTSTVRVEFTQADLRSFLGEPGVTLRGQGSVSATAGVVTISPTQTLVLDSRLDLVLTIGGEG